ncbi:Bromodomain-containing protein [Coemansia reversa NRRL 1564]|uniref:Bromodomain-containing protein n=1 Tax=Coemansia reversa (strain ATCC 12441 / NRRL 1564) TaxID=763665 RepID=A0A2G5BJ55_COERN|nr:Bromodomain-containing protein [Coemansia reversa NRRL 1564]|eukprot:PIA19064.1 Bromodomain-containing protein [Coemansia reversa NRRL 1564]
MADEQQQLRNWKKNIAMVWRDISGHRFGGMFLSPIKSSDAPHYYEVIRQPLDLKTIKNHIRDEEITTTVEFYRDIMHMLMNALMYNSEDTEVYQMTMEILPDAQACIEQLLQTEAVVNQPKDGAGGSGTTEVAITANVVAVNKDEEDTRNEDHDGEDSDASAPAKRKRRVASERASKNLRA